MRFALFLLAVSASAAPDQARIRTQAQRSAALLQRTAAQWKMPCLSCHHQALPAMALEAARVHGIPVEEASAQAAAQRTFRYLGNLEAAVQVEMLIDPALSEGYSLLAAHASGVPSNLSAAVYARHLARFQRPDGHWPTLDGRPPHSAGRFVATAVAARAMDLYLPLSLTADKKERMERARKWLAAANPESTEDLTYRLLGLLWTGAPSAGRRQAIQDLASAQRPDGGWTQNAAMPSSDAYSTAQALVALRRAGGWESSSPAFARGIEWLLKNQAADGSWHVKTRIQTPAPVSPPYFESGFPYGRDQWISCAATAWGVMALAEALPVAASPVKAMPLSGVTPLNTAPWMGRALFGTAADMGAVDPKAAAPQGTTALMMAADAPGKVRALLGRGADPKAVAKSGYDALMAAVLFPGNQETVEILLNAGAGPKARDGVRFKMSPLAVASMTGDTAVAGLLISKGADPNVPFLLLGQVPVLPLTMAVGFDEPEMVRLLVARGAKLDARDPDGMTDVSWAALNHKDAALKALLELGADRTVKDKFGLAPLEHTRGIAFSSPVAERLIQEK